MIDRFEHPVVFIDFMLENWAASDDMDRDFNVHARNLASELRRLFENAGENVNLLREWLKRCPVDPEEFGSAFFVLHSFVAEYIERIEGKMEGGVSNV